MKVWKIRYNTKLIYFILYLITVIAWVVVNILKDDINNFQNIDYPFTFGSILGILFLTSPFLIPFLVVIPYWILKKKIPKRVTLDEEFLKLDFNLKSSLQLSLDDLGYSFISKDNYSVLTIYKKIKAKRGHFVYKKIINILGLSYSLGWKIDHINEICFELDKMDVSCIEPKRKGLFFEYLIE